MAKHLDNKPEGTANPDEEPSEVSEEMLLQLVDIGFDHDKARAALVASGGNFEVAMDRLLSS